MVRKNLLFRVLTVFVGCLLSVGILVIGEFIVRSFKPKPLIRFNENQISELSTSSVFVDQKLHLRVNLPQKRSRIEISAENSKKQANEFKKLFSNLNYFEPDEDIGLWPASNLLVESKLFSDDEFLHYRVTYSIDSFHRRVVPANSGRSSRRLVPFLVMGCSFAYGEGLFGFQTLSNRLAEQNPKYYLYPYAFHAWSAGQVLRWSKKKFFGKDIPKHPDAKAIYLYIDPHLERVLGALSYYRDMLDSAKHFPHYYLDSNKKLVSAGSMKDRLIISPVYELLSHSELLAFLGLTFPVRIGFDHWMLFAAILKSLKEELLVKANVTDFVIVIYPGQTGGKNIVPFLDQYGIKSLDYSEIALSDYLAEPAKLADGHPSAAAIDFLARQISKDLGL